MVIINKLVKKKHAVKTNSRPFFQDAAMPASVMYCLPIPYILSKNAQQSHAAIKGRKTASKLGSLVRVDGWKMVFGKSIHSQLQFIQNFGRKITGSKSSHTYKYKKKKAFLKVVTSIYFIDIYYILLLSFRRRRNLPNVVMLLVQH